MKKLPCRDCGKKRDPHRPVFRRCDGVIEFACRQCWHQYDYDAIMHPMSDDDRLALNRVRRM